MADSKLLGLNNVRLMDVVAQPDAIIQTDAMGFSTPAAEGVTIYVFSDVAGAFDVELYMGEPIVEIGEKPSDLPMVDSDWVPFQAAVAVVGGTLLVHKIVNQGMLPLRILYNPAAIHTTRIIALSYGR